MCQSEVVPQQRFCGREGGAIVEETNLVFCPGVVCADHVLREVDANTLCRVGSESLMAVQHIVSTVNLP